MHKEQSMNLREMPEDKFWRVIEPVSKVKHHKIRKQERRMNRALKKLNDQELFEFALTYDRLHHLAERWDIWEVAYHTCSGCSDDGFIYFRNWLIGRGRKAFYAVLQNPDNLADCPVKGDSFAPQEVEWDLEPCNVWESRKSSRTADDWFDLLPEERYTHPGLTGTPFDENDIDGFRTRYPRLSALYPEMF